MTCDAKRVNAAMGVSSFRQVRGERKGDVSNPDYVHRHTYKHGVRSIGSGGHDVADGVMQNATGQWNFNASLLCSHQNKSDHTSTN